MRLFSFRSNFVLFVLIFFVVGCGSSSTNEAPPTLAAAATIPAANNTATDTSATSEPAEPTVEPTTAPADDAAAATDDAANNASADAPFLALNAANSYGEPTDVASYRLNMAFDETVIQADGSEVVTSFLIEGERDIAGNKAVFSAQALGDVDLGPGQSFTFTEVDDRTYFILPTGQCATFSETIPGGDLYSVFLNDGGFMGELDGASIGNPATENVNGVDTNHYEFNETHLSSIDAASNEVDSVEGHVYVAQDGGYIVRVLMDGIGNSSLLDDIQTEAVIHYELNYFDFNVPVTITIPDGCTEVTESEYPILDDAFAINAIPGVYSYESGVDLETAVLFYETEMANEGWAAAQSFDIPNGKMMGFSNNGEDIQIAINEQGEGVQVSILSTP